MRHLIARSQAVPGGTERWTAHTEKRLSDYLKTSCSMTCSLQVHGRLPGSRSTAPGCTGLLLLSCWGMGPGLASVHPVTKSRKQALSSKLDSILTVIHPQDALLSLFRKSQRDISNRIPLLLHTPPPPPPLIINTIRTILPKPNSPFQTYSELGVGSGLCLSLAVLRELASLSLSLSLSL